MGILHNFKGYDFPTFFIAIQDLNLFVTIRMYPFFYGQLHSKGGITNHLLPCQLPMASFIFDWFAGTHVECEISKREILGRCRSQANAFSLGTLIISSYCTTTDVSLLTRINFIPFLTAASFSAKHLMPHNPHCSCWNFITKYIFYFDTWLFNSLCSEHCWGISFAVGLLNLVSTLIF